MIITLPVTRAGRYIEFVRYIDIFFISDTIWGNTVYIDSLKTSASENTAEDTDWATVEKVHNTVCSKPGVPNRGVAAH